MQNIPLLLKKQILALGLVASLLQADSSFIAYQGVAYDNGVPKGAANIDLNLTIKQSNGTIVYSETQSGVTTTDKGFFAVEIGNGTATSGTYSAITWADDFKLNVQVDYGSGLTDLGDQDLTSTAYALKAKTADSATTATNATTAATTSGNAATATKLAATKTIDITGDITATAVAFDGSSNIAISAAVNNDSHSHTGSTIGSLDGEDITTGTISDDRLPATISSNITGSAASATTATTATNASHLYVNNADNDTNNPILFTTNTTAGNKSIYEDSALYFDSTNKRLYSSWFYGSLSGNASSASTLSGLTSTVAELNKIDGYSGTATELNYLDNLHATGVTNTEFDYLDGVTSNIQTQLNAKAASSHAHSYLPLTGGSVSGQVVLTSDTSTNYNSSFYKDDYLADGTASGSAAAMARYAWTQEGKVLMAVGNEASENVSFGNYKTSLIAYYAVSAPVFLAFSDKRIKENITPLNNSLDIINELNPVSYTKKDKVAYGGRVETGFIAQEVKEILPSAVVIGKGDIPVLKTTNEMSFEDGVKYKIQITKDGKNEKQDYVGGEELPEGEIYVISKEIDDFHSIEYDVLYTHAIKAIQEQQVEIQTLQDEIAQIKEALKQSGIELK